tara:strand:+ start:3365 stop:4267 length:903 start_codon:yes stop_codon:yes gene_type:complete
MKILLTTNKTYRGQMDMTNWYINAPLKQLGHEVYFYDTVNPEEKDYKRVIEDFKPDLIFCQFTGDKAITPHEPWEEVAEETKSGRTKTFNWFCDDTWRFPIFSNRACWNFNVCSTPEPDYLEKYRSIGYNNIVDGSWHANPEPYPDINFSDKELYMSFIGFLTPSRKAFFDRSSVEVNNIFNVSPEEIFASHANSKIGINLSTNDNDPEGKTQMKQRVFEVPAGQGLLFSEYHPAVERYFEIDKEIITFSSPDEFHKKAKFLIKHPKIVEQIAKAGHERFLKDHQSKIRLQNVLEDIGKC